ncbi:hypothetical protein CF392_13850 [Tamilnaduibacter salinus]|uniref:Uncharacterized protein n=1 Tax=Tamilnaduibacter salinus TaxID=1484056 RepID=A0A2A2HZR1_9GAMM|nr:hypothetical protein CF392_13850 [Tamilnaduibacter salinus]
MAASGKVQALEGKPPKYSKEDVLTPSFIASGDWFQRLNLLSCLARQKIGEKLRQKRNAFNVI